MITLKKINSFGHYERLAQYNDDTFSENDIVNHIEYYFDETYDTSKSIEDWYTDLGFIVTHE